MVWFKNDDAFYSHPKVLSIPRAQRLEAVGTWTLAGCWSAHQLTDGEIPAHMLDELGASRAGAEALVRAKLWVKYRGGYRFKTWSPYQPTRKEVEDARESERIRKAEQRAKAKEKAATAAAGRAHQDTEGRPEMSQRDTRGTSTGVRTPRPDPTRPDPLPSEGGAADASQPPTPFCPKHPTGTEEACRACGDARRRAAAWTPPAAAPRPPAWDPETHCEHGQLHGACDACEQEHRHAAEVIRGRFGGAA